MRSRPGPTSVRWRGPSVCLLRSHPRSSSSGSPSPCSCSRSSRAMTRSLGFFKWLALTLLAYVVAAVLAHPDAAAVLRGSLLPTIRFDPAYIGIVVAVLGTTINPYLFFWQAGAEVEDQVPNGRHRLWQRQGATDTELRYRAWDVGVGMFFSQFVAFFIIVATGATLHATGKTNIGSAADAAQALTPLVGPAATLLFSIGIIGTGVLAVPVLTASSAYALSETFDWPYGLNASPA